MDYLLRLVVVEEWVKSGFGAFQMASFSFRSPMYLQILLSCFETAVGC